MTKTRLLSIITIILAVALMCSGCKIKEKKANKETTEITFEKSEAASVTEDMEVEKPNYVEIWNVDVGEGDCAIFTSTAVPGHCVVIDNGPEEGYKNVSAILKGEKITTIDMLILTHPDTEHVANTEKLMSEYSVKKIITPDINDNSGAYQKIIKKLQKKKDLEIIYPKTQLYTSFGGARFEVYAPALDAKYKDIDSQNLITKIWYGKRAFLFLGDATNEEIHGLYMGGTEFKADVVKLSNHGAYDRKYNLTWTLNAISPEYAIISCGYRNPKGHPHLEVMVNLGLTMILFLKVGQMILRA